MSNVGPNPAVSIPVLSIVLMTRERNSLLSDCLDSLARQSYPMSDLEVIVVDDGPAHETASIVHAASQRIPNMRYVELGGRGISAARNAGLRAGKGSLVAFLADDYLMPATYASTAAGFLNATPEASAVRFAIEAADDDRCSQASHGYFDVTVRNMLLPRSERPGRSWTEKVSQVWKRLPEAPLEPTWDHRLPAGGAAVFRSEVFDRLGLFDEGLARGEDTEFAERMNRHGLRIYFDPRLSFSRRYGPSMGVEFRRQFRSGFHFSIYQRRFSSRPGRLAWLMRASLMLLIGPVWLARQATPSQRSSSQLARMLWLHTGYCLGSARGAVAPAPLPARHTKEVDT